MPKFPAPRKKRRPTGARIDHRGTGRKANGDLRGTKPAKKKNWFTAPPTRSTRVDKKLFRPAPKRAAKPSRKRSLGGSGVNGPLFNPKFVKPIMRDFIRQERRQARRNIVEAVAPAKSSKIPKYVRAPKIDPRQQQVIKSGKKVRVVGVKRLAVPRMLDPLSKGAKREVAANERRVLSKRNDLIRKDIVTVFDDGKNDRVANRSIQRLRDFGVLGGKSRSRLARSLAAEKDRQKRVAVERRRATGVELLNYPKKGGTSLERAVSKGAKTAVKFVKADPMALPGLRESLAKSAPVKVAGFNLSEVDKALGNSRNSTSAAALVAIEQLTRISSAGGEGAFKAIQKIKRGGSPPAVLAAYYRGAGKGFVGNKSGYAKPLRELGASKGASAGVGFVADILLDPTTYLTLGVAAAPKAALRAAGMKAARAAVRGGLPRAVARRRVIEAIRETDALAARSGARAAALKTNGEGSAIAAQRAQLDRLTKSGKGESAKAVRIRKNIDRSGSKNDKRVRQAEARQGAAKKISASLKGKNVRAPRAERWTVPRSSTLRKVTRGSRQEAKSIASSWAKRQKLARGVEDLKGSTISVGATRRVIPTLKKNVAADHLAGKSGRLRLGLTDRVSFTPNKYSLRKGEKVAKDGKVTVRGLVSDVAPSMRPSANVSKAAFDAGRGSSRIYRAGRQGAAAKAHTVHAAIRAEFGSVSEADRALWVDLFERMPRAKNGKVTHPLVKRGDSYVYAKSENAGKVTDATAVVIPREFADRYIKGGRLKSSDKIFHDLKNARRGVVRSGQAVGDTSRIRVPNPKATAADVSAAKARQVEADAAHYQAKLAHKEMVAIGSKAEAEAAKVAVGVAKAEKVSAAKGLVKAEAAHSAEVAAAEKIVPLGSGETVAQTYYPHRRLGESADEVDASVARGQPTKAGGAGERESLLPRTIATPISEVNAKAVSDPLDRFEFSTNPANDVAAQVLSFGRIEAFNKSISNLAERGNSVSFKGLTTGNAKKGFSQSGHETLDDFNKRVGVTPAGLVGKKVYEISSNGGRYDLRLLDGEVLRQFVTGRTFDGQVSELPRNGRFVALDPDSVRQFNELRSGEIVNKSNATILYDRLSNAIRRLAIFTPRYQAVNEMGDTWIMFTVVPGLQVPFYKTKAIPVLRYLRAQEAGRVGGKVGSPLAGTKALGDVEVFMGDSLVSVRELANEIVGQGGARQGQFAHLSDVTAVDKRIGVADESTSGAKAWLERSWTGKAARATNRFVRSREDWSRVATYMYLRDHGHTADDAAHKMLSALIDYGDLSKFERETMRRLAFFYTFPARQIPYQTKMLFKRPGKFAAYEKLRLAAANAQGVNLDTLKDEPWYVQANVPIPIKVNGEVLWLSANLPFNMINQSLPLGTNLPLTEMVKNTFYFGMTSLNPVIRAPLEVASGHNFFFRSEVDTMFPPSQVEAPSYIVNAAKAVPGLGEAVGLKHKVVKGVGKRKWVMNKRAAFALSQLMFGPLRPLSEIGKAKNERGLSSDQKWVQFMAGLRFEPSKKEQEALNKKYKLREKLTEHVKENEGTAYAETPAYARAKERLKKLDAELRAKDGKKKSRLDKFYGRGGTDDKSALDKFYGRGKTDNESALDKFYGR